MTQLAVKHDLLSPDAILPTNTNEHPMNDKDNSPVAVPKCLRDSLWKVLLLNGLFFVFSCLTSSFVTMKMKQ
ncbi:hypothetical protein LH67_02925 [Xenorhabdus nematophila]|nr:hypothetical protein LH67_02925 [Xenorhabdus nematophila]